MRMNITIDTQFSTSGPENVTTTYKPATNTQDTGNVSGSGYILGIADKVMDNEAYTGHGMTADDIMQQAANANVSVQKDFMIVMSSCVSGEDLQRMQEEGFRPGSTDVETYVNIVDKIKVTLARAGVEIAGYNDDLDVEKIEQITGNKASANALANELSQALQEKDLPVTDENATELAKAIIEASSIEGLSEDAIKYLIVNQKELTIDNIYKAQYSSAATLRQSQGYYSEGVGSYGKYYSRKADAIHWDNLKGQLEAVVKQAGLDTNDADKAQALETAKWLVESGIELNVENVTKAMQLKELSFPMNQQKIVTMCVTAMENGKSPTKANMAGEMSIAQQAQEIVEEVESITDEAIHTVVESKEALTIKNLTAAQKQIDEQSQASTHTSQAQSEVASFNQETTIPSEVESAALREAQAKRQLEEIRLMMTQEANRHLLKAGISIDTTELSKLVDALRTAEQAIKSALFRADSIEENNQRALLYEETLTKTKELAGMPAAVLGKIASSASTYTIARIHEEGKALQNEQQDPGTQQQPNQGQQKQASDAYETLMTAPRKDLGDKISKAFQNVDDILKDMKLETSEANRRAVRILGYNSMEITQENIHAVKKADSQVQEVIGKMTPAVTLQMIREQKNPLEMTMQELEAYLNDQDTKAVDDTEKYAKFLQKLDRTNAISQQEREAYIGIYRMFRQIEKSDGAVIGNIVSTGAQMNFKNMLSAVRSAANKNMDVQVDDGFGALENLIVKGKAIDEQIYAGYQNQADQEQQQDAHEQEKYYARLSGKINDELADKTDVQKLKDIEIAADTTIETFADALDTTQMSADDPFLKEEQTNNLQRFRQDIDETKQMDAQVLDSLIEYGQSVSVDNMQAASMLLFERGSLFRQIYAKGVQTSQTQDIEEENDLQTDQESGSQTTLSQQTRQFVDSLKDANQANQAYQEIVSEANKAIENMVYTSATPQIDLKAAQALYKGLSLAGNLAREENYEVPMEIGGEITSVNLKIYHNTSQTGKVAVTLDTESLGKVAAEFDVKADRISGMVVYDNRQEQMQIEQLGKTMQEALAANGQKQVSISLVHSKSVDLNQFGQDREGGSDQDKVPTAMLYQTAKTFLTALCAVGACQ